MLVTCSSTVLTMLLLLIATLTFIGQYQTFRYDYRGPPPTSLIIEQVDRNSEQTYINMCRTIYLVGEENLIIINV